MIQKYQTRIVVALIIIAILVIFIVHTAITIWAFGEENQLVVTDVAVVLGAAVWENEPSPVFRERINHSIWLYENGYVEKVIFTGGKGEGDDYAESEIAREYAIIKGIKPDDILVEDVSTITEENLQNAFSLSNEHGFDTFTIVSDPLHMKRAMLMANDIGMEAYSSPTQTSAYTTLKSKIPFLAREVFFYIGYILSMLFR
ncbi:multidrug MFS transporter [Alkalihalobacillus alcalophilus ATCC 27647 = CGMCC 1.3604]|uniref:Multidrug MFS transporter n=1 Tax=Alkalihalobacillus alcalophilus ATCC 27647 = CGMCC 1.3604 TaxID=1218173 RepID=A0A094WH87_ALKAL|nr:YdcF family protein [Alkalihalobacillus alcalophilus]KGA97149.1 multidrug MFS transporter [Alkalihalobacillus alcalophilus ATCC 27647 = CGMCC 1.3604]MED1563093.1 YdcF family protein [Alkalihalobacillus alcalophilus]THG90573.1 multidrug MFS transporter [Alkalihalobacillus alcalophilus ATCC 27647 = CGMCC 1.3604]